ncbi:MAG: hypothetical protein ABI847_05395 [Anaerolineales bacterium]
MPRSASPIEICLEVGAKRVIASALDWPGWARVGRDRDAALLALVEYGPRYARALRGARLGFHPPAEPAALVVVETIKGNATTDYGVPALAAKADARPVDAQALKRLAAILRACWRALDATAEAAEGHKLTTGPRGGGRDLEKLLGHVQGAEVSYLSRLGAKVSVPEDDPVAERLRLTQAAVLKAMPAAARGEFPKLGPRGGVRWSVRYFTRRAAWHVLDHAWELEDRLG